MHTPSPTHFPAHSPRLDLSTRKIGLALGADAAIPDGLSTDETFSASSPPTPSPS